MVSCGVRLTEVGLSEIRKPQVTSGLTSNRVSSFARGAAPAGRAQGVPRRSNTGGYGYIVAATSGTLTRHA